MPEVARVVKVEEVAKEETWPCDYCGEKDVVGIVIPWDYDEEGGEATSGYCERCLGPAVVASFK